MFVDGLGGYTIRPQRLQGEFLGGKMTSRGEERS